MAITLKTWGEQLQEIQEAIAAVLTSQRYSINGREVQRANLEWLHKREDYLSKKLEVEGNVIAGSSVSRGAMKVEFS